MLQILRWQSGANSTARDTDQQLDNSKQQAIASVAAKEASRGGGRSGLNSKATADRTAAVDADTVSEGTSDSDNTDLSTSAATEQGSGPGTADAKCSDSSRGASETTNLADGHTATSGHTGSRAAAAGSSKPMLVLALQHADQEPAALAILQALYAVKLVPELLPDLPQEQQLHASLLAHVADSSSRHRGSLNACRSCKSRPGLVSCSLRPVYAAGWCTQLPVATFSVYSRPASSAECCRGASNPKASAAVCAG